MQASDTAVVDIADVDVLGLVTEVLERMGFMIVSAANADDCLDLVLEIEPRITVVSGRFPDTDPTATAKRVAEISSTLVVIVSADADETSVITGLAAGADAYIPLPVTERVMRARIAALLRRAPEGAAPVPHRLRAAAPAAPIPRREAPVAPAPAQPAPAPPAPVQSTPVQPAPAPASNLQPPARRSSTAPVPRPGAAPPAATFAPAPPVTPANLPAPEHEHETRHRHQDQDQDQHTGEGFPWFTGGATEAGARTDAGSSPERTQEEPGEGSSQGTGENRRLRRPKWLARRGGDADPERGSAHEQAEQSERPEDLDLSHENGGSEEYGESPVAERASEPASNPASEPAPEPASSLRSPAEDGPAPVAPAPAPAPARTTPATSAARPVVTPPGRPATARVITARGLVIDTADRSVSVDETPVELSVDEYDLLMLLMSGARRALSRSLLAQALTGATDAPTDSDRRVVDDLIVQLRESLGDTGSRPRWIETVPGIGYRRTVR